MACSDALIGRGRIKMMRSLVSVDLPTRFSHRDDLSSDHKEMQHTVRYLVGWNTQHHLWRLQIKENTFCARYVPVL